MKTKTAILALLLMAAVATQSVGQSGTVMGELEWANTNVTTPGNVATKPDMHTQFYRWNRDIAWAATGYSVNYTTWTETAEPRWTVNPCPTGWRIPTQAEFESLQRSGYTWANANAKGNDIAGIFFGTNHAAATINNMQGCIFLPALGVRNFLNGGINGSGGGYYWSSTSNGADHATIFGVSASYINPIAFEKLASAHSVRCVQEVTGSGEGTIINGLKWANTNVTTPGNVATQPDIPTEYYQWNSNKAWAVSGGNINVTEWKKATEQEWTINVCPTGWRLPTATEFQSLINSGRTRASANTKGNTVTGMFFGANHANCELPNNMASCIFLPISGFRSTSSGVLIDQGSRGDYWSSTQGTGIEYGYSLYFGNGGASSLDGRLSKGSGANIRCVRTVPTTSINGLQWANTNLTSPGVFAERADMFTEFYQWSRDTAWAVTGNIPTGKWNTAAINATEWTDDPCPMGWRMPTEVEFQDLLNTADYEIAYPENGRGNEVAGFFFGENASTCTLPNNMAGCIFLPASGGRNYSFGRLSGQDAYGYYWSSEQLNAATGYALSFSDMMMPDIGSANKKSGYNIRCVTSTTTQSMSTFSVAQAKATVNHDIDPMYISMVDTVNAINATEQVNIRHDDAPMFTMVDTSTNIPNKATQATAKLYPNPVTNGELIVDNGEQEIGEVEVRDSSGAVVRMQNFGSQTIGTLQLHGLRGTYFVRVGKTTQTIVVK